MRGCFALALVGISISACDPNGVGADRSCDPFEANETPIELREILGIGRDAAGTIYLADHGDDNGEDDHVFVSADGELVRRRVAGGGSGGNASGDYWTFGVEDPFVTLQIVVPTGMPMRMGVAPGEVEGYFEIGAVGEELEVLDEAAVDDMPLRNLPGEVVLEYAGQLDDGRLIVVTRPRDAESYDENRAFFGPPNALDEREILDFARELDGGTTTIEIDVDGKSMTAYFPAARHGLPWTLTLGDDTATLAQLDAVPGDVRFHCSCS